MTRTDAYWAAEGTPDPMDRVEVDGGWSWRLPEGFDPEVLVVGHHLTWAYDGQEVFRDDVDSTGVSVDEILVVGVEPYEVPYQEYLRGMVRIDDWGRRRRPVEIDVEALEAAIEARLPATRTMDDSGLRLGESEVWRPHSWTHADCDGDPQQEPDVHVWNGESRNRIVTPNLRQEAVVQVQIRHTDPEESDDSCTGTLVHSQNQVLTAAHCGWDWFTAGTLSSYRVCRLGGLECRAVSQVQRNPAFTGTQHWEDWMVLELGGCVSGCDASPQSGWNTSVYHMDLSMQSDSALGTITNINKAGVPGYVLTSGGQCNGANLQDPQDLYHTNAAGDLIFTHQNQIRFRQDSSEGDSGGPLYSCPGGSNGQECGGSEGASIFAVTSGWLVGPEVMTGPKVPNAHRDAILAFLTD